MRRFHSMTAITLGLLLVTSGCMGILDSGTLEFSSEPAETRSVDLTNSGYSSVQSNSVTVERTFSAGGQERTVELTNHLRTYEREASSAGSGQQVSHIALFTTPTVEIGDHALNPVADWSDEEVVNRVAQRYDGVSGLELQDRRPVHTLGADQQIKRYTAQAEADGEEVDVAVHVVSFEHNGDVIVGVAVHPQSMSNEDGRIDTIFRGITHG